MKKVINIICSYASTYGGNFIPSILFLADKITKDKANKVIFTFPTNAKERKWAKYIEERGYCIIYIDFGKKFSQKLKSVNKNNNVTIMYSHFLSGLRMKTIYPFSKKIKLLIHIHSDFSGGKSEKAPKKIKRFIEHKILRRDAKYLFVSKKSKEQFKTNDRYIYIPNALSVNRIPCEKLNINLFKEKNQINDSDTVFLHFGWTPYVKGTDVAFKCFIKSVRNNDKCKLLIVYDTDGYDKITSYLKEHNLDYNSNDKRIILVPPIEDIFSLYELSDVFVSSSRSEGFSYSILESLYLNLSVISSDIPGVQWSKKYKRVSFYKSESELENLFHSFVGFKKEAAQNTEIIKDYNLDIWAQRIIENI